MFAAKYKKLSIRFYREYSMEKLNKLKKVIKKGVKVGVLGAGLAASTMLFNSCSNPNGPQSPEQPGYEIPENPDQKQYGTPSTQVMGNGNYTVHSFFGEGNGNFDVDIMAKDLNHYLGKGETYVKGLVDDFSTSLQGRPGAQAYFNEFITEQKNNEFERLYYNPNYHENPNSNPYGIDFIVNRISIPSEPIFEDIIRNIDNNRDRCLFIACYQALSNEAYKYGLGKFKNNNNNQMRHYNSVREKIDYRWEPGTTINNPFDINQDIDQNKCLKITQEMDGILTQVVNKMNNGVTVKDLQHVINISTTAYSMKAMENLAAHAINHNTCNINIGIISAMDKVADEMFEQEQQNLSSMTI